MTNWYTSDHHMDHANIIKLGDRPFKTRKEMEEKLIANHNELVSPDDTVYIIGDFSFNDSTKRKLFTKMNGNKILIKGNHDDVKSSNLLGCYVNILEKGIELVHDPLDSSSRITIHGHEHNSGQRIRKQKNGRIFINVNVEHWDYKPVSEKQIIKLLKENGVVFRQPLKRKLQ